MTDQPGRAQRPGLSGHFSPPAYGFRPVETRVYRSLIAGPAQRVTALVAPTGFGKTVLMTQIHARHHALARCLWLGLDDLPIDLPGLLTQFEDMLGLAHPGDTAPMMVDLRADNPARIHAILGALMPGVDGPQEGGQTILFLDNLNSCDDPDLRLLIDALVFRAPRGVRLFMTSTRAIPFDSTQAMLELKLRRIGPMELSFDQEDTLALLAQAGVDGLPDEVIAHLVARSEGWPAAIRLMQILFLGPDGGPDAARFDEPGAMEGDIAALLSRKLMHSFPDNLKQFLMQISVLRRFSAELAEAATGNPEARFWIDHLVERNVLIVPVSADRSWWRFHMLFREFLVREAARLLPDASRRDVALRAAEWLAAKGEPEQALDMALIARDARLTRDLLERLARPMVRDRGDLSGFLSLVARSTAAGIAPGPDAMFWQAWAMAFSRDYAGARTALRALRQEVGQDGDDAMQRRVALIEIIVDFHLDDLAAVLRKAPLWLEADVGPEIPDGRRFFGRAAVAAGHALALAASHDFPRANRAVRMVQDAITRTDSNYGKVWSALVGATVEVAQGNPQAAQDWIALVAGEARDELGADSGIVTVLHLVEGRIAADMGDHARAGTLIRDSLARAAGNAVLDICWQAMEVAAERVGGPEEIAPLNVLRGHAHRFGDRLTCLLDLAELRGLTRRGEMDLAAELAARIGSALPDEAPMQRAFRDLVMAELLLAQGRLPQAEALAQVAIASAESEGRRSMMVELRLLQAEIALRAGNGAGATAAAGRAIHVAARTGLMRPFQMRGRQIAPLLAGLKARQLGLTQEHEIAFLRRLAGDEREARSDAALLEMLTPRELDLLHQLAAGRSNAQIGERLDLTLPTVKWHLANIYSKLDVGNRSAALARARSLGLVA
ncbi:MAG: LuxR C-terminal-related transcriptional regulator [Paracoccaceae bacterium]